jgi:hypothetical protein
MGWQVPEPGRLEFYRTYVIMLLAKRSWLEAEGPSGGGNSGKEAPGDDLRLVLLE